MYRYELKVFEDILSQVEEQVSAWVNTLPKRCCTLEGGKYLFEIGTPVVISTVLGTPATYRVLTWAVVKPQL